MTIASRYRRKFKMDMDLPPWHEPLDAGMGRRNFLKGVGLVALAPGLVSMPEDSPKDKINEAVNYVVPETKPFIPSPVPTYASISSGPSGAALLWRGSCSA